MPGPNTGLKQPEVFLEQVRGDPGSEEPQTEPLVTEYPSGQREQMVRKGARESQGRGAIQLARPRREGL